MMPQSSTAQKTQKKPKKRRSQAQKVGRLKYIIKNQKRIFEKLDRIDQRTRLMAACLKEFVTPGEGYVVAVACEDEVDRAILDRLIQASSAGVLPSGLAEELKDFGLRRWDVTRRIQRMNKRLSSELDQNVAEKHGHAWAATGYLREVYTATKEEIESE
jgi:hypothetical protein